MAGRRLKMGGYSSFKKEERGWMMHHNELRCRYGALLVIKV